MLGLRRGSPKRKRDSLLSQNLYHTSGRFPKVPQATSLDRDEGFWIACFYMAGLGAELGSKKYKSQEMMK